MKTSRHVDPGLLPARFQKQIADQLEQRRTVPPAPIAKLELKPTTDEERLNKTEKAFLEHIRQCLPADFIGVQCLTFKLADDTRYTPDFVCLIAGRLIAYEVKGFFRDDARVKIYTAARMFRFIDFVLVRLPKGSDCWQFKKILP